MTEPDDRVAMTDSDSTTTGHARSRDETGRARHLRRRQASDRRRVLFAVLVAVVLLVVAVGSWYEIESHPLGATGKTEIVEVHGLESTGSVADQLAARGVIGSSLAFRLFLTIHGAPAVQPGGYLFHQNLSFSAVRSILSAGPTVHAVTVTPGLTLAEVARIVGEVPGHTTASFTKTAASGAVRSAFSPPGDDNLEGLLGTGTYVILPGESDTQLLRAMVGRFDRQATAAGLSDASASKNGVTAYELITVASIVQKEGYIQKNMGPVARVIYNRLARNIPLQMDSTVLYSLGQDGGPVTPSDVKLDTPYNTYLNSGLTPTPIAAPSPEALKAAVSPPPGRWLYFVVVKKDGTMAFSDTYAGQLANERLAQSRGLGGLG